MSLTSKFGVGWGAVSTLGPKWALQRAWRACELRSGLLERRCPAKAWGEIDATPAPKLDWFGTSAPALDEPQRAALRLDAEAILAGRFAFFGAAPKALGVLPPWHRNAYTGQEAPNDVHWTRLDEFSFGDVKAFWELGRFGFAWVLARAYAQKPEPRFAEGFWRLFEDWCACNPPNLGVHWRCGQEASMRLLACSFAVSVLRDAPESTPARVALFTRFVEVTAQRIEAHLGYALSQANNHGLSECIGLLSCALLLPSAPKFARQATARRARALRALRKQLSALVYGDGGFAQHSHIYQRLVVQLLTWAVHLLQQGGEQAPAWLGLALERCLGLFARLTDPETGVGPLYGPDDGTQLLSLQVAGHYDGRPTVAQALAVLGLPLPVALCGEAATWFGAARSTATIAVEDPAPMPAGMLGMTVARGQAWHAPSAGLMHWRTGPLALTLRCPARFTHRPTQLDMLHVSLHCAGKPVLIDPGTYGYNAAPPFSRAFSTASCHNVPRLLEREPARRLSRFLFAPWPEGAARFDPVEERFSATHTAYRQQGVSFVRELCALGDDEFEIVDRVHSQAPTRVGIHWLLADADWAGDLAEPRAGALSALFGSRRVQLRWQSSIQPEDVSLVRCSPDTDRGWQAIRYLELGPAQSLLLSFALHGALTLRTRVRSVGEALDIAPSRVRR